MRHVISMLVENRFGVLSRISGLFSGKGYNLDSICVGETDNPEFSRMTIVTTGDDKVIEQITKQLNKIVNVIKVSDLTVEDHIERELALVKVNCTVNNRSSITQVVDIFQSKIVDISPKTLTVEVVGSNKKVQAFVDMLQPFGIKEIARTGAIALRREYTGKTPNWAVNERKAFV